MISRRAAVPHSAVAKREYLAGHATMCPMSDLVEFGADVVTDTAGDVANPAVTALIGAAAVTLNLPELALFAIPGGALAGAMTAQGIALVRQAWRDRAARVGRFAATAEEVSGELIGNLT